MTQQMQKGGRFFTPDDRDLGLCAAGLTLVVFA
jgi:hypothetical protein